MKSSHIKARKQIWPCHKICHGHPTVIIRACLRKPLQNFPWNPMFSIFPCLTLPSNRPRSTQVIIWPIFVLLEYRMLHISGPLVPVKKNFKGVYHEQAWWSCWSCDHDHLNIFCSLSPRRIYKKIGYSWLNGLWRDVWNCHTIRQRMTLTFVLTKKSSRTPRVLI